MSIPAVVTEPLGGGALAALAVAGTAPAAWYPRVPRSREEWSSRASRVRGDFPGDWLSPLSQAFALRGAAKDRLERVAQSGGVVVTTGQQPGLFGGPVYTWSKALAALELADAIERATGIATAPVFWAATDDADYAEANETWVALGGEPRRLTPARDATEGVPMSEVALGDVSDAFASLSEASGSAMDGATLDTLRRTYAPQASVGNAYVALLRELLQPLGIAVLDASDPAVLAAERPLLMRALAAAPRISATLAERAQELVSRGHSPQVADMPDASLVFARSGGRKERVAVSDVEKWARDTKTVLSPNVLLRPIAERFILPTVAYVAGPGELAYFAQVSAVANALGAAPPLAVPRWSCTIVEPRVQTALDALGIDRSELARRDGVEERLVRARVPRDVLDEVQQLRSVVSATAEALKRRVAAHDDLVDARVVQGSERQLLWRADRLERRLVAATKRREQALLREIASLRASLFPGGKRQERTLNFIPFLARYGPALLDEMRAGARAHAEALVHGRVHADVSG